MNPNLPQFTMKQLFEASVHVGHKTMFWNPIMSPYIYGETNTVHIIDLEKTFVLLYDALNAIYQCVSKGGRILFVATKHQAVDVVKEEAKRCGQYFITKRWPGGLLTNWNTIHATIKNMQKISAILEDKESKLTKKEMLQLHRSLVKKQECFGGIVDMRSPPDMIFVIDALREHLAIKEGLRSNIPVISILDTNVDPRGITYPIPGNDDSVRAIKLYCSLIANTIISGIQESFAKNASATKDVDDKPENITTKKNIRVKEGIVIKENKGRGGKIAVKQEDNQKQDIPETNGDVSDDS